MPNICETGRLAMKDWASIYKLRVSPKHTDKYTGMMDL
jgi:hypothetical protein